MLFDCQWARAVWFGCNVQLNVGHGSPISVLRWTLEIVDVLKGEDLSNFLDAKVAAVLRDWRGCLVDGLVGSVVVSSPLQGELLAIRRACGMAKALNLFGVTIESDKQIAIKLSVPELVPPWEVLTVVLDIRNFVSSLGLCLAWVKREANELAHAVALNAVKGNLPINWISFPPRSVSSCSCKKSFSLL
ncbi:hypothetical protein Vadar_015661 [Vaccinium darrowii]|uniref:Uncharacterized protein n=1 Tax=Vaccinium darrowii TaxID=229202 RepID=A0ACB7X122_9ERIC|nr:hypothetical protein Vadar_015661 [Vaccinium darrowii]